MLAEFVQKIVDLKKTETFEINGQTYSDRDLTRIPPHVDRPRSIEVNSLDSICKLIKKEIVKFDVPIFVQVSKHNQVDVFTGYLPDYSRNHLYTACADVPGFENGWRDREKAIIEIRSLLVPNDDTAYLLSLLSSISDENKVTTKDNGVTQAVTVNSGIALAKNETVRPRVKIIPFRTFLEVAQPESEFILRVDEQGRIGFFAADGGVWKLEAKQNIAKYLEEKLSELVKTGAAVVMQ